MRHLFSLCIFAIILLLNSCQSNKSDSLKPSDPNTSVPNKVFSVEAVENLGHLSPLIQMLNEREDVKGYGKLIYKKATLTKFNENKDMQVVSIPTQSVERTLLAFYSVEKSFLCYDIGTKRLNQ